MPSRRGWSWGDGIFGGLGLQPPLRTFASRPKNMPVKRGLLNPPAASDLNCRNLPALHEIVEARERKAQVIGCLSYSKQIVVWRFAGNLRLCTRKQRGNNAIRRRFVTGIRDVKGCCQSDERLCVRAVWLMSQRIPEEDQHIDLRFRDSASNLLIGNGQSTVAACSISSELLPNPHRGSAVTFRVVMITNRFSRQRFRILDAFCFLF
jgi:hypothetical protein